MKNPLLLSVLCSSGLYPPGLRLRQSEETFDSAGVTKKSIAPHPRPEDIPAARPPDSRRPHTGEGSPNGDAATDSVTALHLGALINDYAPTRNLILAPPIPPQTPRTLSDWARVHTSGLTSAIGRWGVQHGISANAVTIAGTALTVIAAGLIASGALFAAGILLILVMPFDAIDGAIARASDQTSRFGAILDSTLDRYADGFLLLGVLLYFVSQGQMAPAVIAGLALIGAYGVSYVRARAEGLGIVIKDGMFTRLERTIVLIAALISGWVVPGIIILAVGSHLTTLQRLIAVQHAIRAEDISKS